MKKNRFYNVFTIAVIVFAVVVFVSSCEKDEDGHGVYIPENSNSLSYPSFDKNLTTTTTTDVSFRCRFGNGGDKNSNMSCIVHWRKYATKPSSEPKTSEMTNHEIMREYSNGSMTTKTTFDKSHSGFNGGNYIYYYFECSNSKYTTKSDVFRSIVKR